MLQREESSCQPGAVHTWPMALFAARIRTFPKRGVRFVAEAIEEPEPEVRTDLQGAPVHGDRSPPDTKPRLMVLPFACIGRRR